MSAPAVQTVAGEERKEAAAAWFSSLRDWLCTAFETIEDDYRGAPDHPPGRRPRHRRSPPQADPHRAHLRATYPERHHRPRPPTRRRAGR